MNVMSENLVNEILFYIKVVRHGAGVAVLMTSPAIYPIAVTSATAWLAARVASCPVLAGQPTAVCVCGCPGAP